MRGIPSRVVVAGAVLSLALPVVASAQMSSWKDVQVSDIEMDKAGIVSELGRSFEHLVGAVRGMDDAKRMSESSFFGQKMPTHANVSTAMGDMHEHLGQLIAYARTNHVVPPWSRQGGP